MKLPGMPPLYVNIYCCGRYSRVYVLSKRCMGCGGRHPWIVW